MAVMNLQTTATESDPLASPPPRATGAGEAVGDEDTIPTTSTIDAAAAAGLRASAPAGDRTSADGEMPPLGRHHLESDEASARIARALVRRRRRLLDVYEHARYHVLDPARTERWDEIDELRRQADGEHAPQVNPGNEEADDNLQRRRKHVWSEDTWKHVYEELVRLPLLLISIFERISSTFAQDASMRSSVLTAPSCAPWSLIRFQVLSEPVSTSTSTRDDILYFVPNMARLRDSRASSSSSQTSRAHRASSSTSAAPARDGGGAAENHTDLLVRRWSPTLPKDIESMSDCYHWQRSLLVNLVLQTQFVMTIAVYDDATLKKKKELQLRSMSLGAEHHQSVADAQRHLRPIIEVNKKVYASPHFEVFDHNCREASAGMQQSFPTLYFAVCEDFGPERDLLESVVLTDPDQCLCVILNASLKEDIWGSSQGSPGSEEGIAGRVKLFSGFVTYSQVSGSFKEHTGGWKNYITGQTSTRLGMRGPRGKGRAEVAVEEDASEGHGSSKRAGHVRSRSENLSYGFMRKVANLSVRNVMGVAKVSHFLLLEPSPVCEMAAQKSSKLILFPCREHNTDGHALA